MRRARGHGDQVVFLAQDLIYLIADVQAEQARAFHEKTYFVFSVGVFVQELRAQRVFLRIVGAQADHVPALVTLLCDQFVDRMLIRLDHGFRRRIVS